jgi:hypothetical protein
MSAGVASACFSPRVIIRLVTSERIGTARRYAVAFGPSSGLGYAWFAFWVCIS